MAVQERPVCFRCDERIDGDFVFCAPCDHDECNSAVFHPICLMEWREHREAQSRHMQRFLAHHEIKIGIEVREREDDE